MAPQPSRSFVIVTGMHRTGTSAIAGLLLAAGLNGGPPEEFQAVNPDNPRGNAELTKIMELNDLMLGKLGWTWDAPRPQPLDDYSVLDRFVPSGRALIDDISAYRPDSGVLVKDPRISLLLPAWRKIMGDRLVVVVAMRRPTEVASSLRARNGLNTWLGHAIWNAYHRHLRQGLRDLPVICVDYVRLLADPGPASSMLFDQVERLAGVALKREDAASTLDPALRRASNPASTSSPPSSGIADAVFDAWCPEPITVHESFSSSEPADPAPWEEAVLDVHRSGRVRENDLQSLVDAGHRETEAAHVALSNLAADVERLTQQRAAAEDELADLRGERDQAVAERERMLAERDGLITERDDLLTQRDRLAADGERLKAERDKLAASAAELSAERDKLAASAAELSAERDKLAASATEFSAERDLLKSEREALDKERRRLLGREEELEQTSDVYRNSTSWRLTSPLRRMGALARSVARRRTS